MKHLGLDPFTFFLLLLSSLAWRRETRGFWRQMREGRKSPLWPRGQNLSRDHHQFATRCRSHGVIWLSSYSAPLPGAPLFELCTDLLPQATGRSQEGMLSGHAVTLSQRGASGARLIEDVASEAGDEEADSTARVLYRASFQELMPNYLQYDTIIWAMISLLLVMAWGIGLLLLLYLPYKRYVLKRDILSRQLYVTENYIVYKATRPSYLPFMGIVKKEIKVPLHLIVDVIIEQGCLQSAYSLYTFRIESIAHGKPAPVDELQFHGVHNPDLLRKIIIREASRRTQEVQSWKSRLYSGEGPSYVPPSSGFYSPSAKVKASSIHDALNSKGKIPDSVLLHKLEGVSQSVKNLESLLIGSSHTRQ